MTPPAVGGRANQRFTMDELRALAPPGGVRAVTQPITGQPRPEPPSSAPRDLAIQNGYEQWLELTGDPQAAATLVQVAWMIFALEVDGKCKWPVEG